MLLNDKVAIVTGGGRGIGAGIVEKLAAEGATVVVADVQGENARAVAERIVHNGGDAFGVGINVTDPAQVRDMVSQTIEHYGRVEILVCCAGISMRSAFLETKLEDLNRLLAVNLTGPFLCGQAVAHEMVKRQSGSIVNIASISGQRASTNRTAYGTSKGALIQLTKQMAIELAEYGIRVNAIAPGPVDTPMTRKTHSQAQRDGYRRQIPMHRYGLIEETGNAVAFLASDRASFINGHILNVDGGFMTAGLLAV